MTQIIQVTMELMEIKMEYNTSWDASDIEGFVQYILDTQRHDSNYSVDEWLEETERNYPELLK